MLIKYKSVSTPYPIEDPQKKNKSKNASLLWGRAWLMQCNAAGMTDGSSTRAKNVLRTTYIIRDAGDRCPHSHLMKRLPSTPYMLVSKKLIYLHTPIFHLRTDQIVNSPLSRFH